VVQEVTIREIQRIFEVTDAMGIHREALVIPLGARHPGRIRKMPNGKIEIVVDSGVDFDQWVGGLQAELQKL
jgi:hypothetical protein